MGNEKKRLFFAVNLPKGFKKRVGEEILPLVPKERWRKVLPENLHITLYFLGYMGREGIKELGKKVSGLEFECFEAEAKGVGHFKGRVLWLGIGKGSEEFGVLNRKLCSALNVKGERFHAHITLARNKGAGKEDIKDVLEKVREKFKPERISVKSFELMESELRKAGPKYNVIFSKKLVSEPRQGD